MIPNSRTTELDSHHASGQDSQHITEHPEYHPSESRQVHWTGLTQLMSSLRAHGNLRAAGTLRLAICLPCIAITICERINCPRNPPQCWIQCPSTPNRCTTGASVPFNELCSLGITGQAHCTAVNFLPGNLMMTICKRISSEKRRHGDWDP